MAPILVITDGGIPGLLACAAAGQAPGGGGAIWTPGHHSDTYLIRRKAADRAAALYGLSVLGGPPLTDGPEGDWTCRMLLEACILARQAGIQTVVWPVTAGTELDLDRTAAAIDRALLAGRLASIAEPTPIHVRAPYADYTDRHLAELVLDMDLPIWTCWWYDSAGNAAAQAERDHWSRLLKAAGWEGDLPGPDFKVSVPGQAPAPPGTRHSASPTRES